jgi:hypothetical protein
MPKSPAWNGTQFGSLERMAKRFVVQRTTTIWFPWFRLSRETTIPGRRPVARATQSILPGLISRDSPSPRKPLLAGRASTRPLSRGLHPAFLGVPALFFPPELEDVRLRSEAPAHGPLTPNECHDHFKRTLRGSAWHVVRGLRVLRRSFISCPAAAGVDQGIIDDFPFPVALAAFIDSMRVTAASNCSSTQALRLLPEMLAARLTGR